MDAKTKGHFDKDVARFVNIPAYAKQNRVRLLDLYKKAQEISEASEYNFVEGSGDIGIITSGVSYTYVKEFVKGVSILKLGFTNPMPEKKIADFVKGKKLIIVVEELEPFVEDQVLRICAQNSLNIPVYGKRSGHLPRQWEFSPDTLNAIRELVDVKEFEEPLPKTDVQLPNRPPTLCAGCPHRGMFAAAKKAAGNEDVIYGYDLLNEPHQNSHEVPYSYWDAQRTV